MRLPGPLREREFVLLFSGRTISAIGSAMAPVALTFAVLDLTGSTADLGIVLAARQIAVVVLLLYGGVWADRLPRHIVMVGSNIVSGLSQATAAALLLTGHAQIWQLTVLATVNGASSAFFFPASSGIVPQTVPPGLLQQANATLRLSLNTTNIFGAALGALVVAASSPGWGIAIDAVSYLLAAATLAAMRAHAPQRTGATTVFHDLKAGWRDFWSRTWLWSIVIQFGIVNAAFVGTFNVLGPTVSKRSLGGVLAWGGIVATVAVGDVASGFLLLRWRPRRILLTATLAVFAFALPLLALAGPAPLLVVGVAAFACGFCSEIFGVLWDTTYQQEIPSELLSRISAYDALGSWALMPIGFAVAGPAAAAFGTRATLLAAATLVIVATALVLCVRDVRTLERRVPQASR